MKHAILLTFFALVASPVQAAISTLYVFGDSLSDTGNAARLSNGLFWHEQLGVASSPSSTGGNIYAVSGARAADIEGQVNSYLANSGGMADPSATYVIFVGGNDIVNISATSANPFEALVRAGNAVQSILGQAATLRALGAEEVYVMNAPDISLTPAAQLVTMGNPTLLSAISALVGAWNTGMAGLIAGGGDPGVQLVDINSAFLDLNNNPSNYGITNVTGTIVDDNPANPSEYLYYDSFHVGNTAHTGIANLFLATVPEPSSALLITAGGLILLGKRRRSA